MYNIKFKFLLVLLLAVLSQQQITQPVFADESKTPIDSESIVISQAWLDGNSTKTKVENGDASTTFQAGSIAKYICTLAASDLVAEHKLSFDDTLTTLLPGFDHPDANKITLTNILSNRSGLTTKLHQVLKAEPGFVNSNASALQAANKLISKKPGATPGQEFDYLTINWVLVQAILEHAEQKPIADILRNRIFKPANTRNTSIFVQQITNSDVLINQTKARGMPPFLACTGGVASTPTDLLKISQFHFAHFSADITKQITKVYTEEQHYAFGGRYQFYPDAAGEQHFLSMQTGSNGPFKSVLMYDPKRKSGYALMVNSQEVDRAAYKQQWLDEQYK
ncbi:serine hydrolase domain-containing protein [Neptunicella marina]|uniref:Serine hydrolase n=1 Tax=Neptunicella marina TaxID=2125989 RepID=A0A8J6IVG5_9ALTE|nr:serine hydrolase [Neptunicella marina]MBC3766512.1 serine hydrolase [Neptunicella marina]